MGISQFKRNFTVNFSITVKSTFCYNRAKDKDIFKDILHAYMKIDADLN